MCWSNFYSCFAARSRANAFCHSRLQTHMPEESDQIDQRSRSADIGDSTTQIRRRSDPCIFLGDLYAPRKKKTGFRARQRFYPNSRVPKLLLFSILLPHANSFCSLCCWHDDADMRMTWWQDCPSTFVRNSEVFELNVLSSFFLGVCFPKLMQPSKHPLQNSSCDLYPSVDESSRGWNVNATNYS